VTDLPTDRLAVRELIENWAVWRDAGDWARFATVWHDDGMMMATWFQGPAADFIRASREGFARGVSILHFLGGSSIDLAAARLTAKTAAPQPHGLAGSRTSGVDSNSTFCSLPPTSSTLRM